MKPLPYQTEAAIVKYLSKVEQASDIVGIWRHVGNLSGRLRLPGAGPQGAAGGRPGERPSLWCAVQQPGSNLPVDQPPISGAALLLSSTRGRPQKLADLPW